MKKIFIILSILLIIILFSAEKKSEKKLSEERLPFKVGTIKVTGKYDFWYNDKIMKYELKFDHFFFGTSEYRIMKTVKYEGEICKEMVIMDTYNLERIGIDDTFNKGGMYVFKIKTGNFLYYKFDESMFNKGKKYKYEFDGSFSKNTINFNKKNPIKFDIEKGYVIDKRELGMWFVMLYYLFKKNYPVKVGDTLQANILLVDDNKKIDYDNDFRKDRKIEAKKSEITIKVEKKDNIMYRHGYLEIYKCYIPELNINLEVDNYGELIYFNDNNGFEAKLL